MSPKYGRVRGAYYGDSSVEDSEEDLDCDDDDPPSEDGAERRVEKPAFESFADLVEESDGSTSEDTGDGSMDEGDDQLDHN